MTGRRPYGGTATHVPVRGGRGGFAVMIPASLLLLLPAPPAPWVLAAYVLLAFGYAFLPGIIEFHGRPTAEYLAYVQMRIVLAGALGMTVVALIPVTALALPGVHADHAAFGVTTLLIVARVALDTALPTTRQIESWLLKPGYERFLRRG